MQDTSIEVTERPGKIHARPVRHPGRWIAVAAILVIVALVGLVAESMRETFALLVGRY